MSVWTDKSFQSRVKAMLAHCSEWMEAEAECFRENSLDENGMLSNQDQSQYYKDISKVAEIDGLLKEIAEPAS